MPEAPLDEPEDGPAGSRDSREGRSELPAESRDAPDEPPEEREPALSAVCVSGASFSAAFPAPRGALPAPSGSWRARFGAIVVWSGVFAVSPEGPSPAEPDESPVPRDDSCSAPEAPSEPREERREASEESRAASGELAEEPEPALTSVRVSEAVSSGVFAASSCAPARTPPEPPDEESGAEPDAESDAEPDDDDESDEDDMAPPGSSEVGAARGAAPSIGGGASRPGSATAAQGCATTAPPVADTAARSRPETRVARREDIRGVIEGSSSI
ncbi:hypothetical protein [Microbispora rosea]